jgi:riboflavin synthase
MFTGIIDHCGTVTQIDVIPNGMRLSVKHNFTELELGESIAIDGICLTVTQFDHEIFSCDISPETLKITTANNFKVGSCVNLERALQLSSRLGGHFVMAHIDQVAHVKTIQRLNDFIEMTFFGLDDLAQKFVVKKGSIAINGVSLTINEVSQNGFSVMLIPHTLERTNLIQLRENDAVNIEFDMLARMVVKQLENLTQ